MAHFFHDTLPPYQFIDPSLLVDSSPNGVYLPLLGGSTGSAKIGNDYHSFGLEDLEDPKDGLHTPFRSDYGSFLPDTTITPSTQLQQVSSNGFHGSTTKTEPQFENFLELSSALLSSFNAEHEPDYVTEYGSIHAYFPYQARSSAVSSKQRPPCSYNNIPEHTSPYLNEQETGSKNRSGTQTLIDHETYPLAQRVDINKEEEADIGSSSNGEKQPPSIGMGTHQTQLSAPLEEWYTLHRHSPYPTSEEKAQLAGVSGKSIQQVCNWFSNKRSRNKEVGDQPKDITYCRSTNYHTESADLFRPPRIAFNPINGPPITVNGSSNAVIQCGRKGRRRAVAVNPSNMLLSPPLSPDKAELRAWPCTTCHKNAKNLWEWKRHEATHVTGAWICMPEGTPIVDDSCALCGLYDPPVSHFRSHFNLDACIAQPLGNRSFARKDKLNEHIQRIHIKNNSRSIPKGSLSPGSALLEHWKHEPSSREALWCGFCKMYCSKWSERQGHVGAHLQKGTDISLWASIS